MCTLFAKALKQRDTSILFGVIVLASFCMGHACVNVQNAFWKEPVIIWIASVISTGTYLVYKENLSYVESNQVESGNLKAILNLL